MMQPRHSSTGETWLSWHLRTFSQARMVATKYLPWDLWPSVHRWTQRWKWQGHLARQTNGWTHRICHWCGLHMAVINKIYDYKLFSNAGPAWDELTQATIDKIAINSNAADMNKSWWQLATSRDLWKVLQPLYRATGIGQQSFLPHETWMASPTIASIHRSSSRR